MGVVVLLCGSAVERQIGVVLLCGCAAVCGGGGRSWRRRVVCRRMQSYKTQKAKGRVQTNKLVAALPTHMCTCRGGTPGVTRR